MSFTVHEIYSSVRLEVDSAVTMNIAVFWDVVLHSHVAHYQCVGGAWHMGFFAVRGWRQQLSMKR